MIRTPYIAFSVFYPFPPSHLRIVDIYVYSFFQTSVRVFENMSDELGFATRAIHAGQEPTKWTHRAVIPPISMSTNFQQPAPAQYLDFNYSRSGNPTRRCLEETLAALEKAKYALCFASGMGTINTITHYLKATDHVVCMDDIYGGLATYFKECASKMGIEVTFIDLRDANALRKGMKSNTKMVWVESPTNPTIKLVDIAAISKILQNEYPGTFLVVDNTFMSSYFQQPLKLGADIVMQSLTKYMNGHSDVLMGAIATNNSELYEQLKFLQNSLGCVPSPLDCFLVNRGLKTLHLRMQRHMENAMAVSKALECHPAVERVLYPGLKSHPQHELAKKQCLGYSGMVSFYIKGGKDTAQTFICSLKIINLAVSLGSADSLAEIPALMSHALVPDDERKLLGITDNLIRLSVGLESQQDLIKDLEQALAKAVKC